MPKGFGAFCNPKVGAPRIPENIEAGVFSLPAANEKNEFRESVTPKTLFTRPGSAFLCGRHHHFHDVDPFIEPTIRHPSLFQLRRGVSGKPWSNTASSNIFSKPLAFSPASFDPPLKTTGTVPQSTQFIAGSVASPSVLKAPTENRPRDATESHDSPYPNRKMCVSASRGSSFARHCRSMIAVATKSQSGHENEKLRSRVKREAALTSHVGEATEKKFSMRKVTPFCDLHQSLLGTFDPIPPFLPDPYAVQSQKGPCRFKCRGLTSPAPGTSPPIETPWPGTANDVYRRPKGCR